MVWISQGGGASTRSRKLTWPSAFHSGNQSNRRVKLLLQRNNTEAATAAVIQAAEEKVPQHTVPPNPQCHRTERRRALKGATSAQTCTQRGTKATSISGRFWKYKTTQTRQNSFLNVWRCICDSVSRYLLVIWAMVWYLKVTNIILQLCEQ